MNLGLIFRIPKLRSQIKGYFAISALLSTDYWHLQDRYGTCISSGKVVHSYCFHISAKQDILHICSCLPYRLLATYKMLKCMQKKPCRAVELQLSDGFPICNIHFKVVSSCKTNDCWHLHSMKKGKLFPMWLSSVVSNEMETF